MRRRVSAARRARRSRGGLTFSTTSSYPSFINTVLLYQHSKAATKKGAGMGTSIGIQGVNHVALRVRDVEASAEFYKRVLGFTEDVERFGYGVMAFLRAPQSSNHHDLALLQIGPKAADDSPRSVGMFHFALEVDSLEDLANGYDRLVAEGCL